MVSPRQEEAQNEPSMETRRVTAASAASTPFACISPSAAAAHATRRRTAAWYDRYAVERAGWKARNRYYYQEIERLARATIPPGARVLEIGCGIGDLLTSVRPSFGVGLDVSERMLEVAQARQVTYRDGTLLFLRGDAQELPLRTTFDYVICSDLLGHIEDIQLLLDRLHAVCTPQTQVLITYWNFTWHGVMWLAERLGLKMPQDQQNWLGMQDVDNLLELTDFRTLSRGSSLLLPRYVPVLSLLLNRILIRLWGMESLALVTHWVVQPEPRTLEQRLSCSIILPCRNEEGNIAACVERMPEIGSHTELIFVDGSSTDHTRDRIIEVIEHYAGRRDIKLLDQVPLAGTPPPPEIAPFSASAMRPAAHKAHSPAAGVSAEAPLPAVASGEAGPGPVKMLRLGKGDAVRKGFAAASGDVLFILDTDLTVPPEELPKFLEPIASGKAEFVNGTRLVYPLEDEAMGPINLFGNKFFSLLFTWLLGQRIKDTLCGTKVLRKRDYDVLAANRGYFGDFDPFGDFDLLFGAARLGLRIVEVPVRYRRRTSGYSKVKVFEHGLLLLRMSVIAFRRLKLARWLGTFTVPERPVDNGSSGMR